MKKLISLFAILSCLWTYAQTADFTSSQQSVCIGGSIQFFDGSTGATSWSWSFIDGGSGQTSSIPNPIITYNIPGTYSVILTVTNGVSSDTEIKTAYITVVANATLTLTSSPGSNNQTVCENNAITPIVYSLVGATGITASGLPPGVNANFVSNSTGGTVIITGTSSVPGSYPFTITSTGGNCAPVSAIGTITVEASPTLTLTSALGTDAQTLCLLNGILPIQYTFGGSATGVSFSGLPSGLTTSTVGNVLIISGTPSAAGSFNYSVTTTGGSCLPITLNGTITIDPLPLLTLTSGVGSDNPTVCENAPISAISLTIGGSATGATIVGLPVGVSFLVTGSTVQITGTPSLAGVYPYLITTTGGSCTPAVFAGVITVDPSPTLSLISLPGSDNQTVCQNTPISPILFTVGGSATGATVTGLPAGLSSTFLLGTVTISGTPTVSGTFNYSVTTTGGACAPLTVTGTIQVDALHSLSLVSALGTDGQTVCENTPISSIDYQFGGSATGANVTGLPIGVASSNAGSIASINGSPSASGSYSYTISTSGGACPAVSLNGTITVDIGPSLTLVSPIGTDNQVVCEGTAILGIDYSVGGSATGAAATGLPLGTSASFAAGVLSITGTPTIAGTFNYSVTTTGGACAPITVNGVIQVDVLHTISLITSTGSDAQMICENTGVSLIGYQFGGSAAGASVSGLPAGLGFSVTSDSVLISGTASTIGSFVYTVQTSGGACSPVSITGQIDVLPAPTLTLDPTSGALNQVICNASAVSDVVINVGGSATGAIVTGLPVGISGSFNAGVFTISGATTVAGNYPYVVQSTGGPCSAVTLSGVLDVQGTQILLTSAPFTNYQHLCIGTALDTITYSTESPVNVNDLPAGVTATFTAGVPNTLMITGTPTTVGANYYTIQSASTCGSNIVVGSIETIGVTPGNNSGLATTICEGGDFDLSPGTLWSLESIYIYEWQMAASPAGPFVPANGVNTAANYSGSLNLGDTMVYYRRVVTDGICSDTALPVLISVDSLPTISNSGFGTICSNDSLTVSGIVVNNGVVTNWINPGSGQLLNSNTATPTFIPGQNDKGTTVNLSFVVSSNNACSPQTVIGNYPVVILDDPNAQLSGSATICANNTAVNINGANATGTSFSWSHDGNGTLNDTTTLFPVYTSSIADTNSTVTVMLVANGSAACVHPVTDTAYFTINVLPFGIQPLINAFAGDDQTIGLGESTQLSATGVAIAEWTWSPAIGLSDTTISNPLAQPTQTTTYLLTVTDINGCMDQDSVRIIVDQDFDVFIPNLFSPNGDGFNDTWEIPELSYYPNTAVSIINREGRMVYSSDNYDNSWDGTFEGKALPDATYYYLVQFENSDKEYKGAVSILRNKK